MRAGARRGPRQAAALSRAAETGHLPSACRAAGAPRIRYRGHHQDLARSSWLTTTGQRLMPDRRRPLTLEDQPAGQLPLELSQAVAEEAAGSPPDRILTDLNDEQRRAVTHESGPLLIVAGAGTGKTAVITRRIAWLIATRHARPAEILALTFTDKAAAEMEERVDVLVPYGYTDVWLSTFHAFGDRVLRDHALELGLTPDFRILTRAEQVIFFREHLFEFPLDAYRPLGDPTRYIEALIALISRAKDEDCSPAEYRAYANRVISEAEAHPEDRELADFARQQQELALTYQRYQELLASEGLVDFGDLITLTLRLLRDRPAVLRAYRERFKYILVDEFQDTNYAQFQLVRQLVGDEVPQNITVVGDDDQSIYKFRGAAISNILTFLDVYPQATQIVLTRNYRSPQAILDVGYRLIQHNNPDRLEVRHSLDKHLRAAQREGRPPQHVHLDTLSSEADWVAQQIAQRVEGGELRYKDCAILVRSNADADPFLRALNMRGVPHRFTGSRGLYNREEIRLALAFLRALARPADNLSLYYLGVSPLYLIPATDLAKCLSYADRKNRTLEFLFRQIRERKPDGPYADLVEEVPPESRRRRSPRGSGRPRSGRRQCPDGPPGQRAGVSSGLSGQLCGGPLPDPQSRGAHSAAGSTGERHLARRGLPSPGRTAAVLRGDDARAAGAVPYQRARLRWGAVAQRQPVRAGR